jgi:hypothetical protein
LTGASALPDLYEKGRRHKGQEMVTGAGLVTGLIWLVLAATGWARRLAHLVPKPVLRGMILGIGLAKRHFSLFTFSET